MVDKTTKTSKMTALASTIRSENTQDASISLENNSFRSMTSLSRFGIKTPQDMIAFLRSPAGKATVAEAGAELSLEQAIQEQQIESAQEDMISRRRMHALLFLMMASGAAQAKGRNEAIQQQIEKVLHHSSSSSKPSDTQKRAELEHAIADYDRAINILAAQQEQYTDLGQELEQQLAQVEQNGKDIEAKYDFYDDQLQEFENATDDQSELSKTEIETQIKSLTTEMDAQVDEINKIVEVDEDAKVLLNKHNGLNLKVAQLQDMLTVHENKKYYADEEGNPVNSFKDASFILEKGQEGQPDQKIVKQNGKFYLLKPGQDWDSIKDSPEAQQEAEQSYEQSKQDLMSVKKVVQHHRGVETILNDDRSKVVNEQLTQNKEDQLILANQITLIQGARANAEIALNQPNLGQLGSTTPTPTPSIGTSKSSAKSTIYSAALNQIKAQNPKNDATANRGKNKKEMKSSEVEDYYNQQYLNANQLEAMSRRNYILPIQMQAFLRNMERFGIDIIKDNDVQLTSQKNEVVRPQPKQEQQIKPKNEPKPQLDSSFKDTPKPQPKHKEEPEEKHESPSPYNTRPSPLK